MRTSDADRVTERLLRVAAWMAGGIAVMRIWTAWSPSVAVFAGVALFALIEGCHMAWLHSRRNPKAPKGFPEMHRTDHD